MIRRIVTNEMMVGLQTAAFDVEENPDRLSPERHSSQKRPRRRRRPHHLTAWDSNLSS